MSSEHRTDPERDPMHDLDTIIARLERLESEKEIRATMAEYIRRVDRQEDVEAVGDLFTEDAIWEARGHLGNEFGTTTGRAAIVDMFRGLPASLPFTAHFLTNEEIVVAEDGTSATGSWHTLELATTTTEPVEQIVMIAWYNNDFRLVDGKWRMEHVRFEDTSVFPYTQGWTACRFVSPLTLEQIPHS